MRNENLWAPWRMSYIRQLSSQPGAAAGGDKTCFLCDAAACPHESAAFEERLILLRDDRGLMMLNRYPYTSGHLLIAAADHAPNLNDLSATARAGLIDLTALAERLLQGACNPQGLNVGINLGRCAGAGLPGHLHLHVVPRWNGDTNFMDVVGDVRVVPQSLEESYRHLRDTLTRLPT